jgi:dephospho-CoA kinase
MLRVGLTGGYASGKSFVASELETRGCFVIRADLLGHAVLERGGAAYDAAVEAFGPEILSEDGAIDRKKLASMVFDKPELLERLNGIVHPAVIAMEEEMFRRFEAEKPRGIGVLEAAILIEAGRDRMFDRIILTACDEETQIARGMKRDHLSREQVLTRLARQLPLEEKKRHAHYVVDTSGDKQATVQQVQGIFDELKRLAEARA